MEEEEDEETVDEGEDDDEGVYDNLGEALQMELDALAADLDNAADYEAGGEEGLTDAEHARLDEAAAALSGAGDALEVVRAMRQRLRAGKGRGGFRALPKPNKPSELGEAPRSSKRGDKGSWVPPPLRFAIKTWTRSCACMSSVVARTR